LHIIIWKSGGDERGWKDGSMSRRSEKRVPQATSLQPAHHSEFNFHEEATKNTTKTKPV
jgi:hypothetical protein